MKKLAYVLATSGIVMGVVNVMANRSHGCSYLLGCIIALLMLLAAVCCAEIHLEQKKRPSRRRW